MPGAKVHDATGTKEKMGNILYRIGLNAPDDLKGLPKYYGNDIQQLINQYISQYKLSNEEIIELPTVEQLETLKNITHLAPPTFSKKNGERIMVQHTDRAELKEIIRGRCSKFGDLSFIDLNNPFWQGYVTHLVGDRIIYGSSNCVNMKKFFEDSKNPNIGPENARERLHRDWDCVNQIIEDKFGIKILPHIEAKGVVKYIEDIPTYVNVDELLKAIEIIRDITSEMEINTIIKKVDDYFAKLQLDIDETENGEQKQ